MSGLRRLTMNGGAEIQEKVSFMLPEESTQVAKHEKKAEKSLKRSLMIYKIRNSWCP